MSKLRLLLFVSASLLLSLPAAAARPADPGGPPRLYALDVVAQPAVRLDLVPDGDEEFLIDVDPAAVAANPPAFVIDLPGSSPLVATRTRFVDYGPDWKSWFGTLRHAGTAGPGTGFIHLGYHGDRMTAVVDFAGERYRIVGGGEESHRLVRLSNELSPPPCGLDEAADAAAEPLFDASAVGTNQDDASPSVVLAAVTMTTRIDVLAVYPKAFFTMTSTVESSIFTFVQDSISLANNAFANSNVPAYYNLVGIVPVLDASQPFSGVSSSLSWLNSEPAEVTALRNAFGADVVTVYIPFGWSNPNVCGIANLPGAFTPIGQKAYTANRNACGLSDFTLGHEIGHNYGMRHEDDTSSSPLFSFGKGMLLTVSGQPKATVMGCTCGLSPKPACGSNIAAGVCNRIPHFSDPNIAYQGVTTGAADRNNAEVGRQQVGGYANFRSESLNGQPTAQFTYQRCGRVFFFNAGNSFDDAPLPDDAANYRWDFGDGTTGTGKTPAKQYGADGGYRVHLVVKDSGGKTDVYWSGVFAQGPCIGPL
jgi:PKD domain/Metallo-peptidase family M12B Reprolysin-like